MKSKIISALIGVVIGSIFGMAHVRAAEAQTPYYMRRPKTDAPYAVTIERRQKPIEYGNPTLPPSVLTMVAGLMQAEAENQGEYGKRLVVDTILNRVNDERFPDTIVDVIYQPDQFSPVSDGRLQEYMEGRLEIPEENYTIIIEELIDQVDYDVVFFQTGSWPTCGERAYQYKDHYFSR